jgi:hypothetical protein
MTGIDVPISILRDSFATQLWTGVTNKIFYSLVDRNNDREGKLVDEIYTSNNEYEEVQFDDRRSVVCFFDANGNLEGLNGNSEMTRNVGIIFAVNISKVYPLLTYRAKEELYRDVRNVILTTQALDIVPAEITPGLNAYGDLSTEVLGQYNMHPWHTFRVDTTMKFNLDCDVSLSLTYPYPDPIII